MYPTRTDRGFDNDGFSNQSEALPPTAEILASLGTKVPGNAVIVNLKLLSRHGSPVQGQELVTVA